MEQVKPNFGKLNPKAPPVLSRFAFLIGAWEFEAKLKSSNGIWQVFHGTWNGRFILDGLPSQRKRHLSTVSTAVCC